MGGVIYWCDVCVFERSNVAESCAEACQLEAPERPAIGGLPLTTPTAVVARRRRAQRPGSCHRTGVPRPKAICMPVAAHLCPAHGEEVRWACKQSSAAARWEPDAPPAIWAGRRRSGIRIRAAKRACRDVLLQPRARSDGWVPKNSVTKTLDAVAVPFLQ